MFSKVMYSEDIQNKYRPQIDVGYEVWQSFVLQACAITHAMNKDGLFLTDSVAGESYPVSRHYNEWTIYGRPRYGECDSVMTDHVIRIVDIWSYVRHQLSMLSIDFVDYDADYGPDYGEDGCGLSFVVYEYVRYLVDKGYLAYLNTQIGHTDEYDVKLTKLFISSM